MFDIFISYRRHDSRADAGRLYDRLSEHFGDDSVFMDIDDIESGQDFVGVLAATLDRCAAMLVIIGKGWIGPEAASGRRRLDDEKDFVRMELQRAIERKIPIIPVLVGGASMPDDSELPKALAALARFQAHEISDSRFHQDVDDLVASLSAHRPRGRSWRRRSARFYASRVLIVLTMIAVTAFLYARWSTGRAAQEAIARQLVVGDRYADNQEFAEAAAHYRQALEHDDTNIETWRKLIAVSVEAMSRRAFVTGRPAKLLAENVRSRGIEVVSDEDRRAALTAIYSLRAVDSQLEQDVDLLLAEAKVHAASIRDADKALPPLERALRLDSSRPDVQALHGLLRVLLRGDETGIAALRRATTLADSDPLWQFWLAEALTGFNACSLAGAAVISKQAGAGCAQAIRAYHRAYDLARGDGFWARQIRHHAGDGSMAIFHRYANREHDLLTENLGMTLSQRIKELEFFLPLESNHGRSGWHDYPEYWLSVLYFADGQIDRAAGLMKQLLQDKGERQVDWLSFYEKILRRLDSDAGELARVQALLTDMGAGTR